MVTIKSRLASRQVVSVFLFCVILSISVTKNLRQTTQTRWTVKACFWSMVSALGYLVTLLWTCGNTMNHDGSLS